MTHAEPEGSVQDAEKAGLDDAVGSSGACKTPTPGPQKNNIQDRSVVYLGDTLHPLNGSAWGRTLKTT